MIILQVMEVQLLATGVTSLVTLHSGHWRTCYCTLPTKVMRYAWHSPVLDYIVHLFYTTHEVRLDLLDG